MWVLWSGPPISFSCEGGDKRRVWNFYRACTDKVCHPHALSCMEVQPILIADKNYAVSRVPATGPVVLCLLSATGTKARLGRLGLGLGLGLGYRTRARARARL